MFLAIRDGIVVERSTTEKALHRLDKNLHEIVEWHDPLPPCDISEGEVQLDPRTSPQKAHDASQSYRGKRFREYPRLREQLDMIYWDIINETTTWEDEITRIKDEFPKPE